MKDAYCCSASFLKCSYDGLIRRFDGSQPTAKICLDMQMAMQTDAAVFRTQKTLNEGVGKVCSIHEKFDNVGIKDRSIDLELVNFVPSNSLCAHSLQVFVPLAILQSLLLFPHYLRTEYPWLRQLLWRTYVPTKQEPLLFAITRRSNATPPISFSEVETKLRATNTRHPQRIHLRKLHRQK